jgi:hypothetical protein
LLRAREQGIKFNAQKCSIGVKSVPFFGHVITDTGLKADPKKIEAITKLPKLGRVVKVHSDRSYHVQMPDGSIFRKKSISVKQNAREHE